MDFIQRIKYGFRPHPTGLYIKSISSLEEIDESLNSSNPRDVRYFMNEISCRLSNELMENEKANEIVSKWRDRWKSL